MTSNVDRSVLPIATFGGLNQRRQSIYDRDMSDTESVAAPRDAPNIVMILIDDMGFGASSAFGGPCHMPVAESVASDGLKYSRFHTTALCSPTRQSLMTGRNHHAVGMGTIINYATSAPGYNSVRPRSAATIASVLKYNGYSTAAFGKMHQTPAWESSPAGPFDRWPTSEGFDHFYGFLGGEANQWSPSLIEGTRIVDAPRRLDGRPYHLSEDLVDHSVSWLKQQVTLDPERPFFLYLSFGATHAPHHAPQEFIERYDGKFSEGWDVERSRIIDQQKKLGVVPDNCKLTLRPNSIPSWDSLARDDQRFASRLMEAYAGFAEHTDAQVGRLLSALDEIGRVENTLVLYILGDNGAGTGGGPLGTVNEIASLNGVRTPPDVSEDSLSSVGGPTSYNDYAVGWAHAMDTPYQWTKQVASHWGGTRVGMILKWPRKQQHAGEIRDQWHHVVDIYPTLLEAADIPVPTSVDGVAQQRMDGISLLYSMNNAQAPSERHIQYFEMFGNRGIYYKGWSACTKHVTPWETSETTPKFEDDVWELYRPDDWSQAEDVANLYPDKLAFLQNLFTIEAARNDVFPMDDRRKERFNPALAGRRDLMAGRRSMRLYPGMVRLPENCVLNIKNSSHRVSCSVDLASSSDSGVIVAQGGRFGGWVLYMDDGILRYVYNWFGIEEYVVESRSVVSPGRHYFQYRFEYSGQRLGDGGMGSLWCDGVEVGKSMVKNTIPFHTGSSEGLDVGCDLGTPVVRGYKVPQGEFEGAVDWVDLALDAAADLVEEL